MSWESWAQFAFTPRYEGEAAKQFPSACFIFGQDGAYWGHAKNPNTPEDKQCPYQANQFSNMSQVIAELSKDQQDGFQTDGIRCVDGVKHRFCHGESGTASGIKPAESSIVIMKTDKAVLVGFSEPVKDRTVELLEQLTHLKTKMGENGF